MILCGKVLLFFFMTLNININNSRITEHQDCPLFTCPDEIIQLFLFSKPANTASLICKDFLRLVTVNEMQTLQKIIACAKRQLVREGRDGEFWERSENLIPTDLQSFRSQRKIIYLTMKQIAENILKQFYAFDTPPGTLTLMGQADIEELLGCRENNIMKNIMSLWMEMGGYGTPCPKQFALQNWILLGHYPLALTLMKLDEDYSLDNEYKYDKRFIVFNSICKYLLDEKLTTELFTLIGREYHKVSMASIPSSVLSPEVKGSILKEYFSSGDIEGTLNEILTLCLEDGGNIEKILTSFVQILPEEKTEEYEKYRKEHEVTLKLYTEALGNVVNASSTPSQKDKISQLIIKFT